MSQVPTKNNHSLKEKSYKTETLPSFTMTQVEIK